MQNILRCVINQVIKIIIPNYALAPTPGILSERPTLPNP